MTLFRKTENKPKGTVTVADLLHALKDCRPDAEVFVCYFSTSECCKIRKIENCGNYVQLVREIL